MLRHRLVVAAGMVLVLGWLHLARCQGPRPAGGEKGQSAGPIPDSSGVIHAEANMVLIDAVVTDKKKHYIRDLTQKEFHLFEDGREQNIASLSREADIELGTLGQERYLVLFFDNTTIAPENLAGGARGSHEIRRNDCFPEPDDGCGGFSWRLARGTEFHCKQ